MEVGHFTIENTNEITRGNYFICRIMKVTSVKVTKYIHIFILLTFMSIFLVNS